MTSELQSGVCRKPGAPVDLAGVVPGTHLISFYQGDAELAKVAAVFVGAGLAAGDRVLYLVDDRPLHAAWASLEATPAAGSAIAAGQLVVRSFSDLYGGTGISDLTAAASRFRAAAELARCDGFPGLRVAVEMGNYTRALGSIEQVMAWERMSSDLQHELGISWVCHYDQRRPDWECSGFLSAEHDGIAPESARLPQASFLVTSQGLRITGAVDTTNRHRFVRVVRARLVASCQLTVDAGEGTLPMRDLLPAGR
jgi:hypothetical protein